MKVVARTRYSRNMWAIMTKFNILPTNKDFKELTNEQIDWIIASMNEDAREANAIAKGYTIENTYTDGGDYENEVWNNTDDDWDLLVDGQTEEDIYEQVKAMRNDPEYELQVQAKLEAALQGKAYEDEQADLRIKENTAKLLEKTKIAKEEFDLDLDLDDDEFAL